jgi:putative flippase GtrA
MPGYAGSTVRVAPLARCGQRREMMQTERRAASVDSARNLYERFKVLIHEGAKFGLVGIIGVIITDGGTNVLRSNFHLGWLTANVLATVVATTFAYFASRYWTFRHRERTSIRREGVLFFVLNGIGLLIQLACLGFTVHVLGYTGKFPANVALLAGIILGTLFRFWSYRKWVWANKPQDPPIGHEVIEPVLAPVAGNTVITSAAVSNTVVSNPASTSTPAGKSH